MVEESTKPAEKEKKEEKVETKIKTEETKDKKMENKETIAPKGVPSDEGKTTKENKAPKKVTVKDEPKPRDVAVANGYSQRISAKYSFAICKMIKRKEIDTAIEELEQVAKMKKAVPMHGLEVGHKPGNMAGGKYPVKAARAFIDLLKSLKTNATNAMIERPVITIAMANKASRPFRRAGTRGKRTHVHLEAREKTKLSKQVKK